MSYERIITRLPTLTLALRAMDTQKKAFVRFSNRSQDYMLIHYPFIKFPVVIRNSRTRWKE